MSNMPQPHATNNNANAMPIILDTPWNVDFGDCGCELREASFISLNDTYGAGSFESLSKLAKFKNFDLVSFGEL